MRWLALFLALAAFGAGAQEAPSWFTLSFLDLPEDVAAAARDGKRVMLYFRQEGCPYCRKLVETTWREPAIVERMKRDFVSIELDIHGEREVTWTDGRAAREKNLARELRIVATPTLVFLDEKGRVALRLEGYQAPGPFRVALERARGVPLSN